MDDATLLLLILVGLLALIPARIASRKGRSFAGWWIFGVLLWIVAFPASILVGDRRPRCPECVEPIQWEAHICPHCRSRLPEGPAAPQGWFG